MIREVDLASYLPEFMKEFEEPVAALEAENPEFHVMWSAADRILYNRFISTADEYGISRFEKLLGIYPDVGDTLEVRRMRVRNRWFNSTPYTIRMLALKLTECLGKQHNFDIYADFHNTYMMTVTIYSPDDSQAEEVKHLLNVMVPVNIPADIIYESVTSELNIYFGAVMEQADIIELRQR